MILTIKVVLMMTLFIIAWVMVMGIISMVLRHKERKLVIKEMFSGNRVIPDSVNKYIRDLFK